MLSGEELMEIENIVEEVIKKAEEIISDRTKKSKSVKIYHEIFMQALKDVMNVYDKAKPCTDFETVIEAWKRDIPAQLSMPDSLVTPKIYLKNESN